MTKKSANNFLPLLAFSTLLILLVSFFPLTKREKTNKQELACGMGESLSLYLGDEKLAFFEGNEISVPKLVDNLRNIDVLGVASAGERWIEVDLSEQKLKAWEGGSLFLETAISTGLPWWPTPQGEFNIWIKLRSTKMEGGEGAYYYYLPGVPFVMFFENSEIPGWRGFSLHGTYWHNDFGTPRSHGCVNLPTSVAERLYYWTTPVLSDGGVVRSSSQNPGTRIVIHE